MRRGFVVVGMIGVVALSVVACGGGSSGSTLPQPGALRQLVVRTAISGLKKEGVPKETIACVERNIEAMSEAQMAQRVVQAAPAEKVEHESEAERLGPLGKGCF